MCIAFSVSQSGGYHRIFPFNAATEEVACCLGETPDGKENHERVKQAVAEVKQRYLRGAAQSRASAAARPPPSPSVAVKAAVVEEDEAMGAALRRRTAHSR